jgi:single-strand DNA-binding protein
MSTLVHLVGRLTGDPELRFAPSGVAVAKFTVVTSRRVKDQQSGEWSDADTSFWDCVAFKQTAESVCESLQRGMAVIVVGKMAQRTWETKEGEKRKAVEVTVDNVGPDLRFATAKVEKAQRSGGGFGQDAPSGGGRQGGQQQDPYGGQGRQSGPADDPWATGGQQTGFSDDPPF